MLIGYARVSTQEQNLELQISALKKAGCERIYTEKATGAGRDRPELKAALDFMRPNSEDTLVVWKLDRLARSLKQLIETIENLEKHGIGFRSLTEAVDTTTSGGKLIFHIFGALAEFEKGLIKERTVAGLNAAREMGRKGGRPLLVTDQDLKIAKLLLKDKHMTVGEVAKRLKVNPSTLYRYIPGGRAAIEEI